MTTANNRLPALLIMGPTASGKTDLAVELARRFPFEIVSVDSAMVYRGMDIGTAKPNAATLRVAPHRLINILDPQETYSAARFREDALREINEIRSRGRFPLLVGGTMLYYRILQHGLAELPPANLQLRSRLEAELIRYGSAVLHARLAAVDPIAAARIHPHDPQRIQRALEVYELTGQPITRLYARRQIAAGLGEPLRKLIIAPRERQVLHRRIENRFQQMLEQGFVAEVVNLRVRNDLDLSKPSLRAVGYRQVWEYLDGLLDYANMKERSIVATRQFAKRQFTWLRAEPETVWFDSFAPGLLDRVLEYLHAIGMLRK